MRKMSISSTLTATGTGADDAARWKALALNAAPQIKTVLDGELTGFTPTGPSYIGGENDETQLTYRNKALGYDLVVGVRGANPQFGIVYYIRYNGKTIYTLSCNYNAYTSRRSDNTFEADFRVAVYNIDDIIWFIGVERYSGYNWYGDYSGVGTCHIGFTAFKGSYDDETYILLTAGDDYATKIESLTMPLPLWWNSTGSSIYGMLAIRASDGANNAYADGYSDARYNGFVNYSRTGAMPAPKAGHFLYPYCWYGYFTNKDGLEITNFGLALFNGSKVMYMLWDAETNLPVKTEPHSVYTVNGQSYLAVGQYLIVFADPPLRMLQKPGEVLEW